MDKTYNPRIAEARRLARRTAREQGTSYQSELDAIARNTGASSWAEFVQAPTEITSATLTLPNAANASGDNRTREEIANEMDILFYLMIGTLGTVVTVILGACLLVGSTYVSPEWSMTIETAGTVLCAIGILLVPSGMSGYVMGIPVGRPKRVLPVKWRLGMSIFQTLFVLDVAHYLFIL